MPEEPGVQHLVTIVGGPSDGTVLSIGEPWPRFGFIRDVVDAEGQTFKLRLNVDGTAAAGPPYIVDWVDRDTFGGNQIEQSAEGEPGPTGPAGATGAPGPEGPEGPAGPGIDHRGAYAAGTTYGINDVVTYGGASYISLTDLNLANQPDISGASWGLLAAKGDAGAAGPTGPEGPEGDQGIQGVPGSPLPTRTTEQIVTASLAAGAAEDGLITIAKGYRVLRMVTSFPAWVRLYTTVAHRAADATRIISEDPSGDHGVVVEVITSNALLALDLSPVPQGYNMEAVPSASIPYRVVNQDSVSRVITVDMIVQEQEA